MKRERVNAILTAVLLIAAAANAAAAEKSSLTVTSVGFVDGIMYENNAPAGIGRPTYKPVEGQKLVEVKAKVFFPAGKEWDLTKFTLTTKGNKTTPLVGLSYCTHLDGKPYYNLYYLASKGAGLWLREGKLWPVQGLKTTQNKVFTLGWEEGHMVSLKLAFVIAANDTPTILRHGSQKAQCVIGQSGGSDLPEANTSSEEHYLAKPEIMIDVAEGSLIIARDMYPDIHIQTYLGRIDEMAKELRTRLQNKTEPQDIVQVINGYLFKEQRFRYEEGIHFLNEVLDQKRGSCVGLSTLYLALTQRLKIPCVAVNMPRHEFVRFSEGDVKINIEVMAGGAQLPDEWYAKECKIGTEAIKKGIYLQNLTTKELLAVILNNRGNARRLASEYDKAIRDLSLAISFYPRCVDAYYSRGITYVNMDRHEEGIKDCNTALSLDPECTYAYANRGVAYSGKGEYDKALSDYNKATALDPKMASVYSNRGSLYKERGEHDKAFKDYNRALLLDSQLASAYYNRANLFRDVGNLGRAIQDYSMALEINPQMADAHYNCGRIYTSMRDMNNAIASFGKTIKVDPKHVDAYRNRGILHAMAGDHRNAILDCDKAVSLAPESGSAYLMRAMAYGLKKDRNNALRDLEKAMQLDPSLKPVSQRNDAFRDWWIDPDYKSIFE